MLNTIQSFLRFYKSVIGNHSPTTIKDKSIEDIVNHVNYSDRFSSSGQPTKYQIYLIQKAGYAVVINLAPYDVIEYPLKNEEAIVAKLGMTYVHIPVNFLKPTQKDFDAFVTAMNNATGKKVWVHCAIGLRASAFLYRYRCSNLGEDKHNAIWDLRRVWEPFGAWKKFIAGNKCKKYA